MTLSHGSTPKPIHGDSVLLADVHFCGLTAKRISSSPQPQHLASSNRQEIIEAPKGHHCCMFFAQRVLGFGKFVFWFDCLTALALVD
jgi:hypothetical protein